MNRVQQQRAVYAALKGKMDGRPATARAGPDHQGPGLTLQASPYDAPERLDDKGRTHRAWGPIDARRETRSARPSPKNDVVLFMKGTKTMPQCGFSSRVAGVLNFMGVEFADVNVLADDDIRQGIKDFSDWPTIPQLYVKGEFVGGCDIVTEMTLSGELDQLFEDKGVDLRQGRRRQDPRSQRLRALESAASRSRNRSPSRSPHRRRASKAWRRCPSTHQT